MTGFGFHIRARRTRWSLAGLAALAWAFNAGCMDPKEPSMAGRTWASFVNAEAATPPESAAAQGPIALPDDFVPSDDGAVVDGAVVDGEGPALSAGQAHHALARFYAHLSALDSEIPGTPPLRITQVGDSHTASDTFTGPLRTLLQNRFGDAGRGYLYAGTPWSSYRQRDASYSMSRHWAGGTGLRGGGSDFSFGGTRIRAARAGEWIERGPCRRCSAGKVSDTLSVFYLREPGGGAFRILVNNEVIARVDTNAPAPALGVYQTSISSGENTLRVETLDAKNVTLFGTSMHVQAPGIVFDSVGINGAMARHFLSFNPAMTQAEIAALRPDLLILAFGANEAVSSRYSVERPQENALALLAKLEAYREEMLELLARYRAHAPDLACILILPPDMRTRGSEPCVPYHFDDERVQGARCVAPPPANFAGLLNALRYTAVSAGCAVWDQQHAMGGEGANEIWRDLGYAAADGVHLSSSGYEALAEGFYNDLMANWASWRSGIPDPLQTRVLFPSLATSARDDR